MTAAELIDRIERTVGAIYDASSFNSLTQARLRSIRADLDVLRSTQKLPEGWDG